MRVKISICLLKPLILSEDDDDARAFLNVCVAVVETCRWSLLIET